MTAGDAIETPLRRLLVDIVSDPVCPWCYVGLKAFQHARDQLSQDFQVLPRIRAYQLNPDTPSQGVDRVAYYERKFPDARQREEMLHAIKAAAAGAGFQFDPMKPKRVPNSLSAHQLIRLSHYDGAQERLAMSLYASYWEEGLDIGDVDVLLKIAEEAGLNRENAKDRLNSTQDAEELRAEGDAFRNAGVQAVPTFIVNERIGFSGALPPVRLRDALEQAALQAQIN